MDQYIGRMLDDRYEILELIGSGGMANVYKARCHRLNRLVAIKILKSDLADNADFRRRFRDESRAVAQLSHANIVSVYDVSTSGETEYIVMELIDGITLKQYMERRGRMDWRESLHFISQIMRGLSHAHSRGIIHRDIKPQNIMVLRDGSVKVADFGIACLANASQTLTQEALGSVHYISPEQARGDRIDARSDIYSAGVVLYEMLTGRLPFEGDSAVSVAIQHLSSVPLAPRDIDPSIPEPLELICMKAMNSDPDKRYPTADAMLEDLEKFRKDPTVDMDYIRKELAEVQPDSEPTMPLPTAQVTTAMKKRADQQRRSEPEEEFRFRDKKSQRSDTYEPGQIIQQSPEAGRSRKSNFVIEVYVAAEEVKVDIPDVTGKEYRQARIELQELNLDLQFDFLSQNSDSYAKDMVISTIPAAGEPLKQGQKVTLYVSTGPKTVTVPTFIGQDIAMAIKNAQDMGLTVGQPLFDPFSAVETGRVTDQSIEADQVVDGGTQIVFTVSGSGEEDIMTRTRAVEFTLPENMEGMIKVEYEQDGEIIDSQYISSNLQSVSYTFTGQVGGSSLVRAYFTCINDNSVASSPTQEISF